MPYHRRISHQKGRRILLNFIHHSKGQQFVLIGLKLILDVGFLFLDNIFGEQKKKKKFLLNVISTLKVCHLILLLNKELILKHKDKNKNKNEALGYDPWASATLTHAPGT